MNAHTPVQDEVNRLLDTFEDDLVFDVDQHSDDEQDVQVEIAEQLALLRKHRSLIAAAPDGLALAQLIVQMEQDGERIDTSIVHAAYNLITRATGRERG